MCDINSSSKCHQLHNCAACHYSENCAWDSSEKRCFVHYKYIAGELICKARNPFLFLIKIFEYGKCLAIIVYFPGEGTSLVLFQRVLIFVTVELAAMRNVIRCNCNFLYCRKPNA